MSVITAASRFILPPLRIRFYQHLFTSTVGLQELGNKLVRYAEYAHSFRKIELVREVAETLSRLPLKQYQTIGQYYLAWCDRRSGDSAIKLLERVADIAPADYRARAMHVLATIAARKQDIEAESRWLKDSLRVYPSAEGFRGLAVLKAKEGFHSSALRDLENFIPMIRYTEPLTYYDFLNSYAVELGEVGRKDEARNVIKHVLASPFAFAYPEWRETAQVLREPNRSFVAVPQIKCEPVKVSQPAKKTKPKLPARVISFPPLKEAPEPKKPERLTPQEISGLTLSEKRELVLAAIRTGTFTPFDYDRFMTMVGLIEISPADKVLDLEAEATLSDIAVVWANQVEPDNFAAVLSALRDCEDDQRRNEIIDRMIRIAFEETHLCGLTEEAWRLRVERRLPKK